MWSSAAGASSSSSPISGPSTPFSNPTPASSSSSLRLPSSSNPQQIKKPTKTSKPDNASDKPRKSSTSRSARVSALPVEVWRDTFLEVFPALPATSQSLVDDWYSNGIWDGPVCDSAYLPPSESEEGSEPECSAAPKTNGVTLGGKGKGKNRPRPLSKRRNGGSFWKHVSTHCQSLDVDAVRSADSRIIHAFLGSICAPRDVFLCGTQFSGALYPRCACHSKAKTGDSLRIALESVGLPNFNVHELDRVIFVVEMHNRWFVVLATGQWVVVYDPAGFSRLEPDTVSQLAEYVADAFLADTARWPDLDDVPDSLKTRIISPDIPIDPTGSAVLVCGAIELMVALPALDDLHYPGLEVSLWFLSESIHKGLTHEHYRRLLAIAFKEVEGRTKNGDSAGFTALSSTVIRPRPRLDAPKVPFKSKRRIKRKKPFLPPASLAKHEVSPELASALRAADRKAMRGSKLDKVLLDRVVWTCNSGHLPSDDGCSCEFTEYCDDLFAHLGLDRALLAGLGLDKHHDTEPRASDVD